MNQKNKKGFTLIELLAVIVILAIIALIAVPIVLNMIEDARKSAAVDSAYGYIKAVEYEIGLDELKNKNRFKDGKEDVENLDINVKGTKPTYGEIEIKNKNIIYANMCINGYMVTYENEKAKAFDRCTGSYDKTGPEIILGQVSGTTNSLTIPFEVVDNESEIKEIKCYYGIDKKYEKEGKIENNKCVITGLKNNTLYNYKIEATNAGGIKSTKEDSETTRNFEGLEIKVDTADWAQSKEITIIGSTEGSKLQYQINEHEEDKWIDIEDGYKFTIKENGTIYARLYDGTNSSEEVEMTILNIDTTSPTCTWDGESTSWRQSGTITAICEDIDGSGCTTSTLSKSWTYTSGTETIKTASLSYTIEDKAGNTEECSNLSVNVYVDRTAPTCTFSNESTNWRQSATIKATCSDTNGSGCTTSTSSKSWAYTSGTTTTKTASLSYTIEDNVGNTKTCGKTANVYVDRTPPTCTFSNESTNWRQSATIKATCSDTNGSGCTTSTSSKSWAYTNGTTTTKTASLSYTIEDNVGNTATCKKTANVYVDRTPPTVTCSVGSDNNYQSNNAFFAYCTDSHSGCINSINDDAYSNFGPMISGFGATTFTNIKREPDDIGKITWSWPYSGSVTVTASYYDKVGNSSTCTATVIGAG